MQIDRETRIWLADRADYLSVMLYVRGSRDLSALMELCGKVLRT